MFAFRPPSPVFAPGNPLEVKRIGEILRRETVGGGLLLGATVLALLVANLPSGEWYQALRATHLGFSIAGWSFELSLAHWAADGLLAVFFFLAGLELKREFLVGDLRSPAQAAVPVAAAFGGVAVPAVIYTAINSAAGSGETLPGWAIPTATDIAFALAVLAVVGRSLPVALRTFLLTLAVVDDLIAITIIAVFYTTDLKPGFLLLALIPLLLYGAFAQTSTRVLLARRRAAWFLLLPLGALCWGLVYLSGVHATIAGVALAFTVPVKNRTQIGAPGLAEVFEHRFRPLSAGFCVPVFAFFSAGVSFTGLPGGVSAFTTPVALGIIFGLIFGKAIGITAATWAVTRLRSANLHPSVEWPDVFGLAILGGIGFTVSLLISDLSFPGAGTWVEVAKAAVLAGSVLSAFIGGTILALRGRRYAQQAEDSAP